MGSKITIQQLAKTLAQKKKLSQKDAEAFLKEFFDSIVQNVTTDKLVKIKGLGTFKLIEVQDRESVHVNTGERFIIPGHSKLSFIPETALKDLVNKPFADFQTVIINEGTSLEEMERLPEEAPIQLPQEEEAEPQEEEEAAPQEAEQTKQEEQEEPTVQSPAEEEKEAEEEADVVPAQEDFQGCAEEITEESFDDVLPLYGPPPARFNPKADEPERPLSVAKIVLGTVGVLLLCFACFLAGRYVSQKPSTNDVKQAEAQIVAPEPEAATATSAEESLPAKEDVVEEFAQVPGGKYRIVGTRGTYVMKPGDFITRIAIQEYDDKDVAQYIIVHNAFPDPDNVPVGMEIKLPELEKIE